MAKYSRSALSMKESLKEISEQKAEQFSQHFLLSVGHRSIADLAHLAFAIEKLSILAAIVLWTSNDGWAGALHALPELQEERLLHSRLWQRTRPQERVLRHRGISFWRV